MSQFFKSRVVTAVAGLVMAAGGAWGHHSFAAEFDDKKPVSTTGVITKIDWINPHAYIYLDAKNSAGAMAHWSWQTLPPSMMRTRGVTRDLFPVGQTVTISGFAAKDGTQSLGWIKKIQYADGRVLQMTAEEENSK